MENRTAAPKVLEAAMSEIASTNGKILEEHLGEIIRTTVEETLNGLLDAEAERICGAERYERKLQTKAGTVEHGVHQFCIRTCDHPSVNGTVN